MLLKPISLVFSMKHPSLTCKIEDSIAGIQTARWSPDNKTVVTISDMHVDFEMKNLLLDEIISLVSFQKLSCSLQKPKISTKYGL